jgi:hypothetical protein
MCPLCEQPITKQQAALDHCHETGVIRMVLHKHCNGIEGRINNWAKRNGRIDKDLFVKNVLKYWNIEHKNPIHPRHKKK